MEIYKVELHWNDLTVDVIEVGTKWKGKEVSSITWPSEGWINIVFAGGKTATVIGVPMVLSSRKTTK